MTEQQPTARRITLANPEEIADLVCRFDKRLQTIGGFGTSTQRLELVMAYHNQLLIQLTDPEAQCGALRVEESGA